MTSPAPATPTTSRSSRFVREDVPLSVLDHLEDLRARLLQSAAGLVLAWGLCYAWSGRLLAAVVRPPVDRLVFTSPLEPFLAHVAVSLAAGVVLAFPWLLFQAWLFVAPGLEPAERRWVWLILPPAYALFLAGAALGLLGIAPLGLTFLLSFSTPSLQPMLSLEAYLRYVSWLALGSGVLFQLPVVIFFLAKLGVVTPAFLAHYRAHVLVGLLAAAAALTPGPDVVSQLLVAAPAYALYELSILATRLTMGGPS